MKYVYVLTSAPEDFYYEQALMSVYSLRKKMPDAKITVLTDDKTKNSFSGPKYATSPIPLDFRYSLARLAIERGHFS